MKLPIQVLPLGGLGEIGMNCMLVGHRGRWVMVDCGVQWPDEGEIGAERKLVDPGFFERWSGRVEAVLITHGHEDHIGGLPWVLPVLGEDVPVFASSFTRELIGRRMSEHGGWDEERVAVYAPGRRWQAGPFEVEALRVTHSIPDAASLVLRCDDGTILHTGDWKIDELPLDGERFDRAGFERVGREGVTLMLSDSTNIQSPGRTRPEREVVEALAERVAEHSGRVLVTLFASNLHRVGGLAEVAERCGRRLVFAGRSLWAYLECADRDGRAPIAPSRVVDVDRADRLAPDETLIATTGSQGERNAALFRAAASTHPQLELGPGDLLLHSARIIPGNEASVYRIFNGLSRLGVDLVYGRRTGIHTSGHAQRDELSELLDLVRPAHFVPVHGEYTFLKEHARLAREVHGIATTVIANGEQLGVAVGRGPRGGEVEAFREASHDIAPIYNDGPATGSREEMKLQERLRIAWNGVAIVGLALARGADGAATAEATVEIRAMWDDGGKLRGELRRAAERVVAACPPRTPVSEIEEAVRASLRRLCRRRIDKRPDVIVLAHQGRAQ